MVPGGGELGAGELGAGEPGAELGATCPGAHLTTA